MEGSAGTIVSLVNQKPLLVLAEGRNGGTAEKRETVVVPFNTR